MIRIKPLSLIRASLGLFVALGFLSACGETDQEQTYIINGESKVCTIITQAECGLTLACKGEGFYECVNN